MASVSSRFFLFFDGGVSRFHCMVHRRLEYVGDGCVVVAGCGRVCDVVDGSNFRWRIVVDAWSRFDSCKEPFF